MTALKNVAAPDGVEVDAGIAERFDLAVVAEGGVFATAAKTALVAGDARAGAAPRLRPDRVGRRRRRSQPRGRRRARRGVAYERFTRHGPAALLPLQGRPRRPRLVRRQRRRPGAASSTTRSASPCSTRSSIRARRASPRSTPLKAFPLGLSAERTLTDGRTVRIGNAAQTLHPVAGQGLNLGLRDAFELVRSLRASTATSTPSCAGSNGSARPIAGR